MRLFSGRRKRHDELIAVLISIERAMIALPYRVVHAERTDYSHDLKKIVDVSKDVQGAAELFARWLVLQLPAEARKDVPLPEDWKSQS